MRRRPAYWFAGSTLALSILLACLSLAFALATARLDLQKELSAQLPERLAEALRYSIEDGEVLAFLNQQIRDDLANIRIQGLLPLLQSCSAGLIRLSQQAPPDPPVTARWRVIPVDWLRSNEPDQAEFTLDCQINVPLLGGVNLVLAAVLMGVWLLLPLPLSADQKKFHDNLLAQGVAPSLISRLMQHPNAGYLQKQAENPWLRMSLQQVADARITLDDALAITAAEPEIHFLHHNHVVVIHGIRLVLPKTPYFYYAWYAIQRQQGALEGWILNPAVDRPERRQAVSLISLMEKFGGHQKAINDLREHGLRSKILDQNRNKIKEELVAALGEELASEFLFETRRDARSSRYCHRLCCPPERILINASTA
jgi:hypothetical protein